MENIFIADAIGKDPVKYRAALALCEPKKGTSIHSKWMEAMSDLAGQIKREMISQDVLLAVSESYGYGS